MRAKLTKIYSNHKRLRTDTVEGITLHEPREGRPFALIGKGLEVEGSLRLVTTSRVTKCEMVDGKYRLLTESGSVYEVELGSRVDPSDPAVVEGSVAPTQKTRK